MTLKELQILSPVAIVSAAVIFIGLERLFPYTQKQRVFREGFWVDLIGYGLVQSYLMALVISFLISKLDSLGDFSRLHLVSDWPIALQLAFFITTHDLNTYIIHRLQHRFPWLWRTHEAHHSTPDVDWLSGIRSHSAEILLYESVKFIPIILMGASPEIPLYRAMIDSIYGMYIHSNLNWKMGPLLYLFNGPELHRWHHAIGETTAYGKNFATKLSLWDHLFKTTFKPGNRKPKSYGVDDPQYPNGYIAQHLYCFR